MTFRRNPDAAEIQIPRIEDASHPPQFPITIEHTTRRKSATARIRHAAIQVTVPRHWPKTDKDSATRELIRRIETQFSRDCALLAQASSPKITLCDKHALLDWVMALNTRTCQVPVQGVRVGHARYSHLAQMNLQTQVMTVSRHCLTHVPESALRYLIIHELAHLKVPNHSKPFWQEVGRFVPDYRYQRRLIAATHRLRIYEADCLKLQQALQAGAQPVEMETSPPGLFKQLVMRLF